MRMPNGYNRRSLALFALAALLMAVMVADALQKTYAATQSTGIVQEVEIGAQKIVPAGVVVQLTVPANTQHAEIYIEGAAALVRWNGVAPVDSATGAMKWPDGHFRKEANDGRRLSGLRLLCSGCTVWVNYSRWQRSGDPR